MGMKYTQASWELLPFRTVQHFNSCPAAGAVWLLRMNGWVSFPAAVCLFALQSLQLLYPITPVSMLLIWELGQPIFEEWAQQIFRGSRLWLPGMLLFFCYCFHSCS